MTQNDTAFYAAFGVAGGGLVIAIFVPFLFVRMTSSPSGEKLGARLPSFALSCLGTAVLLLMLSLVGAFPMLLQSPSNIGSAYSHLGSPASINFCEKPDFGHSMFVAEPLNTVSSLVCFSVPALFGLFLRCNARTRLQDGTRFAITYLVLFIMGLGSASLHATLLSVAQAGDELPMIYFVTMLAYNAVHDLLDQHQISGLYRTAALSTFPLISLLVTVVYCFFHDMFAVFGFIFVGYAMIVALYFVTYLYQLSSSSKLEDKHWMQQVAIPLSMVIMPCASLASFCWAAEMWLCDAVEGGMLGHWGVLAWRYGMHTGWHLFAGLAAYLMIVGESALAGRHVGNMQLSWRFLPYLSAQVKSN